MYLLGKTPASTELNHNLRLAHHGFLFGSYLPTYVSKSHTVGVVGTTTDRCTLFMFTNVQIRSVYLSKIAVILDDRWRNPNWTPFLIFNITLVLHYQFGRPLDYWKPNEGAYNFEEDIINKFNVFYGPKYATITKSIIKLKVCNLCSHMWNISCFAYIKEVVEVI